ncbi:MAG: protein kinase [Chitinivibrionales bacterium]|nr:protein kinase [Chitinivibrionales bacterium]
MKKGFPSGYELPVLLGNGAFASVYRARQVSLDRFVVLKIIHDGNEVHRNQAEDEAKALSAMNISCTPRIYDIFRWQSCVCIAMQWIRGITLEWLLKRGVSPDCQSSIAGALIQSLAQLHDRGIFHGDIKPSNIMISPEDGLFLIDFGFAGKALDDVAVLRGTPEYLAPELMVSDAQVDAAAVDIYACGKVLKALGLMEIHQHLQACINEQPDERPDSARAVLELWQESGAQVQSVFWKQIAGTATAEFYSRTLYRASHKEKSLRREDNAYKLLIESLQENPDNEDAIAAIEHFKPSHHHHRFVSAKLSVIVAVCMAAGIAAVYLLAFGTTFKQAGSTFTSADTIGKITISHSRKRRAIKLLPTGAAFKVPEVDNTALKGGLTIYTENSEATALANGVKYEPDRLGLIRLDLDYGAHLVTVLDSTDAIVQRERIRLLPFETKAIAVGNSPGADIP